MKRSTLALLVSCGLFSTLSHAAPVQVSSFGNFPADSTVNGFHSAFLYGDTGTVNGFDLPILGYDKLDQLNGFQLGLVAGSQIRNGVNGATLGLFNWHGGDDNGVNIGLANQVGNLQGVNIGLYSGTASMTGLNLGLGNYTGDVTGVNLAGVANYTTGMVTGLNIAPFNWTQENQRHKPQRDEPHR